jgi:hypothetical protein
MQIPKASQQVVEKAIATAVEDGSVWLLSGPASVLGEPIPAGVLTPAAKLSVPPAVISAAEILSENLPAAWKDGETTALAIATALSQKVGKVLPWKTVRDVINESLRARFTELVDGLDKWPCEYHAAQSVRVKVAATGGGGRGGGGGGAGSRKVLVASASLEPSQIQDLSDLMPQLLAIKAKTKVPIQFRIEVELGDGQKAPPKEVTVEIGKLLAEISKDLHLR